MMFVNVIQHLYEINKFYVKNVELVLLKMVISVWHVRIIVMNVVRVIYAHNVKMVLI